MRFFTSAAVFSALVLSISAFPSDDEGSLTSAAVPHLDFFHVTGECIPSKAFIHQCNSCFCSSDGKNAVCTKKACPTPEKPHIDGYGKLQRCPAGKRFYDDCNACVCNTNGISARCTLIACSNTKLRSAVATEVLSDVPVVYGYKQGDKCPAEHFKDDCNSCVCGEDGVSAGCTFKLCPSQIRERRSLPNYPHIDNFHEVGECTPGQNFIDICNTCRCGADGKSAACTLVGCLPVDKPRIDNYVSGKKCPAGKTFYNKCNSCKCSNDGRSAGCTLMACPDFE